MATIIRKTGGKQAQAFLKAGRSTGRLLPAITRSMMNAPEEHRRSDILHPSAMAKKDWCPRGGWRQLQGWTVVKENNALRRQNIFDEGHAIHDKWQSRISRMGNLYGLWQCRVCETTWWATSPRLCPEPRCCSRLIKYREVPLENKAVRIGGHSDGWVKGLGDDFMIEIKSVGTGSYRFDAPDMIEKYGEDALDLWKNTRRPFTAHLKQGQIYLRLANETMENAPKSIIFLYESKANQDYKEFDIPYDPDFVQERWDEAADIVARIKDGDPAPKCVRGPQGCHDCNAYTEPGTPT